MAKVQQRGGQEARQSLTPVVEHEKMVVASSRATCL